MKKKLYKMIVMVVAVVTVFALTTTAFAGYWVDYATWTSSKCLVGFSTLDTVDKETAERWDCITAWVGFLTFAKTPQHDYLYITPKTASGVTVGDRVQYAEHDAMGITIESYKSYNSIKLRIDNPNTNNNMKSGGQWDGYVE